MTDTNTTLPPDYEPPSYDTCSDGVSDRCPVEASLYGDYFNLGACVFFVVAHGIALIPQLWFGIRARTWSFTLWLAIGTIFEIMGYVGRVIMSSNPWVYNAFVIQLVMLILGPTLVAASISVTFKHLVLWYGREYSFMKPVLYPWVFVGTDFFSIVIQAAGGGVSSVATGGEEPNQDLLDVGSGLLVAGVVFQMANMVFCGGLMLLYIWRRRRAIKNGAARLHSSGGELAQPGPGEKVTRASDKKTKTFVYAITAAYVAIIIRCMQYPGNADGLGQRPHAERNNLPDPRRRHDSHLRLDAHSVPSILFLSLSRKGFGKEHACRYAAGGCGHTGGARDEVCVEWDSGAV
ncbi:hypothetical protein ACJ41O_006829 [Fusarium nematophilum]